MTETDDDAIWSRGRDMQFEERGADSDDEIMDSKDGEQNEETALVSEERPAYKSLFSHVQHRVRLTWENLNVTAPVKRSLFKIRRGRPERAQILRSVSGRVESGQLIAIMGASGSGKTTLLNVLTARNIRHFKVDGRVCVNGQEVGRKITSVSAYVQQDDLFLGTLTVREHLIFQALLRLPKRLSRAQKIARADEVIFELGLKKCSKTRIGTPGILKGISGGEAKRLAFASEVLRNPPILFCDEPTTGIDSYMAQSVVKVLQNLAAGGKAILCTIHQPVSDVYTLFDRVMFLAEGRVAYSGSASNALEFFASQGYQCPNDYNPADFLIHTLAVAPGQEAVCKERIEKICDEFARSESAESMSSGSVEEDSSLLQAEDISKKSPYNASWPFQFVILVWRSLLFSFRDRNYVLAKVLQKSILALFLGLLYLNNTLNQNTIMNYNGALFFVLAEMTFPTVFGLLTVLPQEFPLLVREHHNGMYTVSSYYLAKVISFIPIFSIDGVLFIGIAYFMIGLRPAADAFFIALALSLLLAQCSVAFAIFLSSISPSLPVALSIAGPITILLQMTGGLFANLAYVLYLALCIVSVALAVACVGTKTIPPYISWVQYISWFRYGYESYAINQWHDIKNITCDAVETACLETGDDVLAQLSFNPGNLTNDVLYIFALIIGFHIIGYLGLLSRTYRAR